MLKSVVSLWVALLVVAFGLSAPRAAQAHGLSDVIELPDGWTPEGIAAGPWGKLYMGSIGTGAVYQASAGSGLGDVLVPPQEGRSAVGLKWDVRTNYLYVAGGASGKIFVYDAETGADVAVFEVPGEGDTLVNDVVITRRAVYVTDSYRPVIYRLRLGPWGRLGPHAQVEAIPLGGDFPFIEGEINGNGIEATPNGNALLIVNTVAGALYRVNPRTGFAREVDLGADDVSFGDGLLLLGNRLYVVQNFLNQIATVTLSPRWLEGEVTGTLTNEGFDVPTTIARVGFSLYAVNARFSTPPTPATPYTAVRVPLF